MSSILDALRGRPRSADRQHLVSPQRTGHADVVLETLGHSRRRWTLARVLQAGRLALYAAVALLLILAVWAVF